LDNDENQVPIQNFTSISGTDNVNEQTINKKYRNQKKMDGTDLAILNLLSENARYSATEISKKLQKQKIKMSERGVRKRIKSLQKHDFIKGFTIVLNDEASGKLVRRLVLVKFRNVKNFRERVQDYQNYISESPYCIFAIKLRSDFDWLHLKCFPTTTLADEEDEIFRAHFGDIMAEYRSYDAEIIKSTFNSILDESSVKNFLQKFIKD